MNAPTSAHATSPRIAIVGAGAIGSRMAAHFDQHGRSVTLFDGWREHVQAIERDGLWLEHAGQRSNHRLRALHFEDVVTASHDFDIVLLAVRGDATDSAMPLVMRLLKPGGCVVACQNGICEDTISDFVGSQDTLGCSMIFGARVTGPGVVEALHGEDTLCVGEMVGVAGQRALELRELFACCGTASTTDDLLGYRWKKLVYNCMGNPLTLLSGQVARDLHAGQPTREVMIAIAREVMATARASGSEPEPVLDLPADRWLAPDAFDSPSIHAALKAHGDFLDQRRFSMWADFQQRGRTEVEALNGYVVKKAAAHGLTAPMNEAVRRLVRRLEDGEVRSDPGLIAQLRLQVRMQG